MAEGRQISLHITSSGRLLCLCRDSEGFGDMWDSGDTAVVLGAVGLLKAVLSLEDAVPLRTPVLPARSWQPNWAPGCCKADVCRLQSCPLSLVQQILFPSSLVPETSNATSSSFCCSLALRKASSLSKLVNALYRQEVSFIPPWSYTGLGRLRGPLAEEQCWGGGRQVGFLPRCHLEIAVVIILPETKIQRRTGWTESGGLDGEHSCAGEQKHG